MTTDTQQAAYYRLLRNVFCAPPDQREARLDALEAVFERVVGEGNDPTPALFDLAMAEAIAAMPDAAQ